MHLGQVLVVEGDVVFIDFEGEPRRAPAERRTKQCPLIDVAGMVRSVDYAAQVALRTYCGGEADMRRRAGPAFDVWRRVTTEGFLVAYHVHAAMGPGYPGEEGAEALIAQFCLEKALYEVRYELDNRPEWAAIPLSGLDGMLGGDRG